MYLNRDGSLRGVNSHPGNYGNLRGLGDDASQDDEGEDEDASGMGVGAGMPYGLGAFIDLKQKVTSGRKPKVTPLLPVFTSERSTYPASGGVPARRSVFSGAVRRFKGV